MLRSVNENKEVVWNTKSETPGISFLVITISMTSEEPRGCMGLWLENPDHI